jgi:glycine dehydrogenase subunit 1
VLRTYLSGRDLEIQTVAESEELPEGLACVIVQQPSFLGGIQDLRRWGERAKATGALFVVHVNPIALGLLAPPGELGADIVTAEAQPLGQLPSFGGPYAGIFACRAAHVRQMPGRICGMTTDHDGRRGFVLTLQAREQHIRRERATSNICTNQALIALAATVYLAMMGKHGLRKVAEICCHRAHHLAAEIAKLPGYRVLTDRPFFNEFVVDCPVPVADLNRQLLERKIIGGLALAQGELVASLRNPMLVCVTEMNTPAQLDRFVEALSDVKAGVEAIA